MSVQRVEMNVGIDTICPIVVNSADAILTFKTASGVATLSNVNSQFSSCHPDDYAYLQVFTAEQANKCCSYNVSKGPTAYVMGLGKY
jgi:hypothetical protein